MSFRRTILPDPAGVFGLVVFLILARFSGPRALLDGDTLWHIRIGQDILDTGRIPAYDTFSHTVYGQPWIAHEWLSEVIMGFFYELSGLSAVCLFYFCVAALSLTFLYQSARHLSNDWTALAATATGCVMAMTHLLARPHLFSWLLGSLTLWILLKNGRSLWLLPFLTALWSNLHGGVLLGIVFQGAFLAGPLIDRWRDTQKILSWNHYWSGHKTQIIVFLLSLIALGCNPFGYHLIEFQFQVSHEVFAESIKEWQSPDLQEMWYVRYWLLGIFLLGAWYGRRTEWHWVLLLLFLVYEALLHKRHISVAGLFLIPWIALVLQEIFIKHTKHPSRDATRIELKLSPWSGPLLTISIFIALLSTSLIAPAWWQDKTAGRFPLPESYSREAIEFLKDNVPGDKLLNEYSWGDYLIYAMDYPPPLFIDGRADMYGKEIFSQYISVQNVEAGFEQILAEHNIDWVLFPRNHVVIRYLLAAPEWQEVYRDEKVQIISLSENSAP